MAIRDSLVPCFSGRKYVQCHTSHEAATAVTVAIQRGDDARASDVWVTLYLATTEHRDASHSWYGNASTRVELMVWC